MREHIVVDMQSNLDSLLTYYVQLLSWSTIVYCVWSAIKTIWWRIMPFGLAHGWTVVLCRPSRSLVLKVGLHLEWQPQSRRNTILAEQGHPREYSKKRAGEFLYQLLSCTTVSLGHMACQACHGFCITGVLNSVVSATQLQMNKFINHAITIPEPSLGVFVWSSAVRGRLNFIKKAYFPSACYWDPIHSCSLVWSIWCFCGEGESLSISSNPLPMQ